MAYNRVPTPLKSKTKNWCEKIVTEKVLDKSSTIHAEAHSTPEACDVKGTITVKASGGKSPYKFTLFKGNTKIDEKDHASQVTFDGLDAGDYSIKVQDKNWCETIIYETVKKEDSNIYVDTHPTHAQCDVKGAIKVTATGGKAPYRITITGNGVNETKENDDDGMHLFDGLQPGTYTIKVQDKNWCEKIVTEKVLDKSSTIHAEAHSTPEACDVKGTITVKASGGKSPYKFTLFKGNTKIDEKDHASQVTFDGLDAGDYSIKVQDKNWCETIIYETVKKEDSNIYVDTHPTHAQCDVKGAIKVTATGGKAPYRITITGNGVNETKENDDDGMHLFDGLQPGTYTIKVQDKNWCEKIVTEKVLDKSSTIHAEAHSTPEACDVKGTITVKASGGKSPYKFTLFKGNTKIDEKDHASQVTFDGLDAGDYSIKVQDKNWCETIIYETVKKEDSNIYVDTHPTHAQCDVKGAIKVTATGGKAPYRITITGNGVNETKENDDDGMHLFDGLQPGTYTIKVQDKNWCEKIVTEKVLDKSSTIHAEAHSTPEACDVKGTITVKASGGKSPYKFTLFKGNTKIDEKDHASQVTFDGLDAGDYSIKVQDKNWCETIIYETVKKKIPISMSIPIRLMHSAMSKVLSKSRQRVAKHLIELPSRVMV